MSKRIDREDWQTKKAPPAKVKPAAPPPPKAKAKPLVKPRFKVEDLAHLTLDDLYTYAGALIVFDPGCLYRDDGTPVALGELDEITRVAIQALEVEELYDYEGEDSKRISIGFLKKIRQYDRLRAIEIYAELKGWKNGKGQGGDKQALLREYLAAVREGYEREKKDK